MAPSAHFRGALSVTIVNVTILFAILGCFPFVNFNHTWSYYVKMAKDSEYVSYFTVALAVNGIGYHFRRVIDAHTDTFL